MGSTSNVNDDHDWSPYRDPEYVMARLVLRIQPTGLRVVADRVRLSADQPLNAFWQSVLKGGKSAWDEEQQRIQDVRKITKVRVSAGQDPGARTTYAVQRLLPWYRQCGQILMDIGQA